MHFLMCVVNFNKFGSRPFLNLGKANLRDYSRAYSCFMLAKISGFCIFAAELHVGVFFLGDKLE